MMTIRFAVAIALGLLAAASPAAAQSEEKCRDRLPTDLTTIDLRGADVQTTLRLLAERYRVSVLVSPDVTGLVTVSLFEVPVRDAFEAMVRTAGLMCVVRDGILVVAPAERLRKEIETAREQQRKESQAEAEARKKIIEARREELALAEMQARGPLREETIRLIYADAVDVAKTLIGILGLPPTGVLVPPPTPGIYAPPPPVEIPSGPSVTTGPALPTVSPGLVLPDTMAKGITVSAYRPTNSIFIRHYDADVLRIKRLIQEQLDIPMRQVQIAAQMVVVVRNALEQLGVQWGGAVVGGPAPTILGRGLAQPIEPTTGAPVAQGTGVGVPGSANNPTFNRSNILPVSPTTGLPLGGNIVNLPVSALPTLANPALGLMFGIVGRNFNVNLAIQALETQGKARSLAEPKTVTVENATAIISRGFEVPYVSQTGFGGTQVQFKDALLKLEVTPRVIREADGNQIRMKILVENNEPDFTRSVLGNPPIFKRRAENEVVIRDGERLVIGGVLTDNDNKTLREVPGLGRIPVLGWLFKSRELTVDSQVAFRAHSRSALPLPLEGASRHPVLAPVRRDDQQGCDASPR
jgi:type IV pilus assembly protein PilQ